MQQQTLVPQETNTGEQNPLPSASVREAFKRNWPEYLMEAAELGLFMVSACLFVALIEHPASPVRQAISAPLLRRLLIGVAMGLTAIGIIYSPLGKRSGAHFNPSVTLAFYRLGKIGRWDALFYVLAQFIGGAAGVMIAAVLLGNLIINPSVHYAVTSPGDYGVLPAFVAEILITFILMSVILTVSNTPSLSHFTGLFAGALVALYITFESPISGMSMNPARTFGSALGAHDWRALWVYFIAPTVGMLAAAEIYLRTRGAHNVLCAKLHHNNRHRCLFCESRRRF